MRQVVTVSLNGRAYQLEDDAHTALAAYLDSAARALTGNPDHDEILADLEQAIADKCDRHLGSHKTVIVRAEIAAVLAEMGPVDSESVGGGPGTDAAPGAAGSAADDQSSDDTGAGPRYRRLYQISDGAMISGVCNGFAAYFALDVTVVRLIFVVLALMTGGVALFGYLVLMFVVPYANTSEEHAAAHGVPFNARVLVERAKRKAADFATSTGASAEWQKSRAQWRDDWRQARAQWRSDWRRSRDEWRAQRRAGFASRSTAPPTAFAPPRPVPYAAHVFTGILIAILGLFLALFSIVWVIVLLSLVTTGAILGWPLPFDIPFWIGIVGLAFAWLVVALPIKALRRVAYGPAGGFHGPWVAAWDGIAGIAVLIVIAWLAYHHVPAVRDFIGHLGITWTQVGEQT
jgi:phage shock protein PspC (stress-responsive transcriptional regulator)